MRSDKTTIGELIAETTPPFLIQIYGTRKVVFEACRRILEYSDETIVIEGRERVRISGKHLNLKELGCGNLAAVGRIDRIEFLGKNRRR